MIDYFRQVLGALQSIADSLRQGPERLEASLEPSRRLQQLEAEVRSLRQERQQWLADLEGLADRAEGKLKAARAAEERSRGMMKRAEALSEGDSGDEEGEEEIPEVYLQAIRQINAGGGEEGGVQPMREDVAPPRTPREEVTAKKWGR